MSSIDASAWLSGYIPDIPTPFDENGAIDLKAFEHLCERQIRAGVSAILVGETAGEFSTLTAAELDALIRTAVDVADGRVLVIAGAGSNSSSEAVERTRHAEFAGADAIMSVVPYYNKPMQAGIAAHFQAVADSTALPIVLHDVPARTIRELSDDTLANLARSRQFIGLRDATGDLARPVRLRAMLPPAFRLLSADDTTALAFLVNGGDGCVSTVSNIAPATCQAIFSNCRRGRTQSARDLQQRLSRLATFVAKDSPAAVKYALSLLGLMRPDLRLPLVQLSSAPRFQPSLLAVTATASGWRATQRARMAASSCSRALRWPLRGARRGRWAARPSSCQSGSSSTWKTRAIRSSSASAQSRVLWRASRAALQLSDRGRFTCFGFSQVSSRKGRRRFCPRGP